MQRRKREERDSNTHEAKQGDRHRPFQHKIKMNGDRLVEAEEAEGKSLRTVDGVGQNGGMKCKVGQRCHDREEARVDCVRPSRAPTSICINSLVCLSKSQNRGPDTQIGVHPGLLVEVLKSRSGGLPRVNTRVFKFFSALFRWVRCVGRYVLPYPYLILLIIHRTNGYVIPAPLPFSPHWLIPRFFFFFFGANFSSRSIGEDLEH
jgi:hypothetical protein